MSVVGRGRARTSLFLDCVAEAGRTMAIQLCAYSFHPLRRARIAGTVAAFQPLQSVEGSGYATGWPFLLRQLREAPGSSGESHGPRIHGGLLSSIPPP
jgi:hypothetical protein